MPFLLTVVWTIHHPALALASVPIAVAIGIGAVVKAFLILASHPIVPCVADAATNGKLHGAPTVAAAVARTVLDAAVIANEWRGALALPKAVANAVAHARDSSGAGLLVELVAEVLIAVREVVVGKATVAAVLARVLAVEGVPLAERPRAGRIRTVTAVVAIVALAETQLAVAVVAAVVQAVLKPELPHVAERLRVEGFCPRGTAPSDPPKASVYDD